MSDNIKLNFTLPIKIKQKDKIKVTGYIKQVSGYHENCTIKFSTNTTTNSIKKISDNFSSTNTFEIEFTANSNQRYFELLWEQSSNKAIEVSIQSLWINNIRLWQYQDNIEENSSYWNKNWVLDYNHS